jgi:ABC-type sugar transport system permease subunit
MKILYRKSKAQFSYQKKKSLAGFLFIFPWVVGFTLIFLRPLVSSIVYSVSKINFNTGGVGYSLNPVGFTNYIYAFTQDPEYVRLLTSSLLNMAYQVPIIVLFSLFIAIILNQKFFGRTFARAVFFLPVVIANGVIISLIKGDALSQVFLSRVSSSQLLQTNLLGKLLIESGISMKVASSITGTVDSLFELIWKSGLQILIFIGGLQSISPSLYEASKVEGATGWENFWKITFPMISPITMLNLVYTIIDSFTDYNNPVMSYVSRFASELHFEYSSAIAWIYFIIVALVLMVAYFTINRHVFYNN